MGQLLFAIIDVNLQIDKCAFVCNVTFCDVKIHLSRCNKHPIE